MRIVILAFLALAGCATQPTMEERAQQMSAAELCLGLSTFRPENAATAQREIERRGVNCQDHAQAVHKLQQQRAQAMQILLNQPPTRAYQLPMPQQQVPRQTS